MAIPFLEQMHHLRQINSERLRNDEANAFAALANDECLMRND